MAGALPTFVIIGVAEMRDHRAAFVPRAAPPDLDVAAQGARLLRRRDELGQAESTGTRSAGTDPRNRSAASRRPTTRPTRVLKGVPERMAAPDPGREADLHGPRSDRPSASRIPASLLEPAEDRPMREAVLAPGRDLSCSRSQYYLQLTPVPGALPDGADHAPRAGRVAERPAARRSSASSRSSGARRGLLARAFNEPRLETATRGRRTRLGVSGREAAAAEDLAEAQAPPAIREAVREARDRRRLPRPSCRTCSVTTSRPSASSRAAASRPGRSSEAEPGGRSRAPASSRLIYASSRRDSARSAARRSSRALSRSASVRLARSDARSSRSSARARNRRWALRS